MTAEEVGLVRLQQCPACAAVWRTPTMLCPQCHGAAPVETEVSLTGTVSARTTMQGRIVLAVSAAGSLLLLAEFDDSAGGVLPPAGAAVALADGPDGLLRARLIAQERA